jgi:NAD(P)-dependent dehydrogenase (short-subunit alcohol dehydrogenase family)
VTTGEFSGQVAIVTGGSRGIGRAVAGLFVARGASVVIVGRDVVALATAVDELNAISANSGSYFAGNVADAGIAQAMVAMAIKQHGRVDILANIAGAFPTALIQNTSDEQFAESIAANLTSTFMMTRTILPSMLAAAQGVIVNMSSTAARLPTPGLSVYGAAKAGVEAFTRAVAAEVAPAVRVNAVSAGPTLTDAVRSLMETDTTGAVETVTKALPLRRLANPIEIAEAIAFLASARASFITGQVLHANGGGIMA